jgi:transcriptional regulator with XRE-family HTH domain
MAVEGKSELRALGDAIRAERKKFEVSQEDFAEMCDLHRTYVGQVERGEKNISFINILRVSRALGVEPSLLLKRAGL